MPGLEYCSSMADGEVEATDARLNRDWPREVAERGLQRFEQRLRAANDDAHRFGVADGFADRAGQRLERAFLQLVAERCRR